VDAVLGPGTGRILGGAAWGGHRLIWGISGEALLPLPVLGRGSRLGRSGWLWGTLEPLP
jgi:hypothetical protein